MKRNNPIEAYIQALNNDSTITKVNNRTGMAKYKINPFPYCCSNLLQTYISMLNTEEIQYDANANTFSLEPNVLQLKWAGRIQLLYDVLEEYTTIDVIHINENEMGFCEPKYDIVFSTIKIPFAIKNKVINHYKNINKILEKDYKLVPLTEEEYNELTEVIEQSEAREDNISDIGKIL